CRPGSQLLAEMFMIPQFLLDKGNRLPHRFFSACKAQSGLLDEAGNKRGQLFSEQVADRIGRRVQRFRQRPGMRADTFVRPSHELLKLLEDLGDGLEIRSWRVEAGQRFEQSRKIGFGILSKRSLVRLLQGCQKELAAQT